MMWRAVLWAAAAALCVSEWLAPGSAFLACVAGLAAGLVLGGWYPNRVVSDYLTR